MSKRRLISNSDIHALCTIASSEAVAIQQNSEPWPNNQIRLVFPPNHRIGPLPESKQQKLTKAVRDVIRAEGTEGRSRYNMSTAWNCSSIPASEYRHICRVVTAVGADPDMRMLLMQDNQDTAWRLAHRALFGSQGGRRGAELMGIRDMQRWRQRNSGQP